MDAILVKNGIVESVISGDSLERIQQFFPDYTCVERTPELENVGPGYTYTDGIFTPPIPEPIIKTWESGWHFAREFTALEEAGIRNAAKTDPLVETLVARAYTAPSVRADDPDLILGMGYFVQQGLLTAGRKAEIMGE